MQVNQTINFRFHAIGFAEEGVIVLQVIFASCPPLALLENALS